MLTKIFKGIGLHNLMYFSTTYNLSFSIYSYNLVLFQSLEIDHEQDQITLNWCSKISL